MEERSLAERVLRCILELREHHRMTWGGADLVVQTVNEALDLFIKELQEKIEKRGLGPEVCSSVKLEARKILLEDPLKDVSSEHRIMKLLRETCGLIVPQEIKIGETHQVLISEQSEEVSDVRAIANFVPFENQLVQLLKNTEYYNYCFDESVKESSENVIRNAKDGKYVKNHPIYAQFPDCLLLQLYEDDVELTNPLGAHTKVHKVTAIYWQLLNLPEHVRSSLTSINLLGFAKSGDIKMFGFEGILRDFFQSLEKLGSPEGLNVDLGGETLTLHGFLVSVNGDSLALNSLGGFKEAFSFANKPCRTCNLNQEEMKTIFLETNLRDLESYRQQVKRVTDETVPKGERVELSKLYGINSKSVLEDLPHFDLTKCLVQDFMHSYLEGVLEVEIRALLFELLEAKKLVSYDALNCWLKSFPYPLHFSGSKPSAVEKVHIQSGKLRQNASQMLTLMYILPFIVEPFATGETYNHVQSLSLLAKIGNILLAFEVEREVLDLVRVMIATHHSRYSNLFPNYPMTPKFHFMVHLPSAIDLFGPIRISWTMRYEALNAWVSRIGEETRNFKNITKTLATRFQVRKCLDYGLGDKKASVLGAKTFLPKPGQSVDLSTFQMGGDVARELCIQNKRDMEGVLETTSVAIKNFEIEISSYLLLHSPEMSLPKFGQVTGIFVKEKKCAFVLKSLKTLLFNQTTNAYEVSDSNEFTCLESAKVPFLHALPCIRRKGKISILLQYHSRCEYLGI